MVGSQYLIFDIWLLTLLRLAQLWSCGGNSLVWNTVWQLYLEYRVVSVILDSKSIPRWRHLIMLGSLPSCNHPVREARAIEVSIKAWGFKGCVREDAYLAPRIMDIWFSLLENLLRHQSANTWGRAICRCCLVYFVSLPAILRSRVGMVY